MLYYSNININHCLIEFTSTLFSFLFLIVIISPALIILLDFDLIILPSFIIYPLGLQWAWQFNIIFLPVNIGFESYCDHYIISTINKRIFIMNSEKSNLKWITKLLDAGFPSWSFIHIIPIHMVFFMLYIIDYFYTFFSCCIISYNYTIFIPATAKFIRNNLIMEDSCYDRISCSIEMLSAVATSSFDGSNLILPSMRLIDNCTCMVTRYLFDISQYILLPIYSFIRLFVYSFDVIHTLGFYSWGIKIDAIPGRINLANTLRLLWKGEYRGKCFELCGQGHLSMIINSLVLLPFSPFWLFSLFYLI